MRVFEIEGDGDPDEGHQICCERPLTADETAKFKELFPTADLYPDEEDGAFVNFDEDNLVEPIMQHLSQLP